MFITYSFVLFAAFLCVKHSVAEMVAPVDEWRLHEAGNAEHRSQGLGKHHAEKVSTNIHTFLDQLEGPQAGVPLRRYACLCFIEHRYICAGPGHEYSVLRS